MDKNTLNKKERNKKVNKVVIPIALGIFAVLLILLFLPNNEGIPNHNTAQKISREFIIKTLIDPKSAEFIDDNLDYTIYQDSTYIFRGAVKATNRMGLSAPSEYVIIMKWTGGTHSDINQWRVIDLKLQ